MMVKTWFAIGVFAAVALAPATAAAQVSRVAATFALWTAPARGSAIAYDPKNDVYLAVSAAGILRGRFITADGTVSTSRPEFVIQSSANYTHYPRVAYSPDAEGGAGGFLVTWSESDANIASVHARIVSYAANGPIGADTKLTGPESFHERGANIAYSTGSREFLVVWATLAGDVHAVRVNNAAAPISAVFSLAGSASTEDNPSVAYNPAVNEFMVIYPVITDLSATKFTSTLQGNRIRAGTGEVIPTAAIATAVGIFITDVAYNPATGLYLATWYQDPPRAVYGRLLNADGAPAGNVNALSSRYAAYDALSLAHNTISGTFFAISHDSLGTEDGGVEINNTAEPLTSGVQATGAGGSGNFYPRIASHSSRAEWMAVASGSFIYTHATRLQTATRIGGGTPPPPPPPPAATLAALTPSRSLAAIANTYIVWTAAATGGTGPLEYRFWRFRYGAGWTVLRDYSTAATALQTIGPGWHKVRVDVRSTGGSAPESSRESDYFSARSTGAVSLDGNPGAVLLYDAATGVAQPMASTGSSVTPWSPVTYFPGATVYPADFDGDGLTDFLLYNSLTGQSSRAMNTGSGFLNYPVQWAAGWQPTIVDFDGDGLSDLFLYNPTNGKWWRYMSTGTELLPTQPGLWAPRWKVFAGDYNGDGLGDLFLYNDTADVNNGKWFRVLYQAGGAFQYVAGDLRWANNWQVTPGDFDGDGRTDIFLYGNDGRWFRVTFTATSAKYAGSRWATGWTVRAGDFNSDRRSDLFVYNQTTGRWFVVQSLADESFGYYPGIWAAGWQFTVTDVNGDGFSDLLVYNPVTGEWYRATNLDGANPGTFGYTGGNFGASKTVIGGGS